MVKTFRDLIIWKKAMEISVEAYSFTKTLPEREKFGLISQIQRSSISIPSNIAEGFGRNSKKDFRRFLRIAMGSLFELQTQIDLAKRIYMQDLPDITELYENSRELERILSSFIRTL